MQKFIKRYLVGVSLFLVILFIATTINRVPYQYTSNQTASVLDLVNSSGAKQVYGFAWNDNVGWINFGTATTSTEGQVYASSDKLYGYAWGENVGWISMNCNNDSTCGTSNYSVSRNINNGVLTGYAWGENIGWINFAPTGGGVTIDPATGNFSGYAWGENVGWISFSGTSPVYGVHTAPTGSGSVTMTSSPGTCTFTYSNWSICSGGTQSRTATPSGSSCSNSADQPLTQTCTATSTATTTATTTCIYNNPNWGACVDEGQSRTLTAQNAPCTGPATKTENRGCTTVATTTATTTNSGNLVISPANTVMKVGETIPFVATFNGQIVSDLVDWSVLPFDSNNFYGTITNNGLYTAPDKAINVTIVARSRTDVTKFATTTVDVRLNLYNVYDGYIFNNNQKLGDGSEDVANLQNRLKEEAGYTGLIGGYFGSATVQALENYQKANNLDATGELDDETRAKLNGVELPKIATTTPIHIVISPTTVAAGDQITINSDGWLANSQVIVSLHSDPVTLGTLNADTDGSAAGTVTIPFDTIIGSHVIELAGTGTNGSARTLTADVTVTAPNVSTTPTAPNTETNNVPAVLNVSKLVTDNIMVLGTTTAKIFLAAQKIAESNVGSVVTKTITTTGVVGGGIAASAVLVMSGATMTDLLFLPFRLWSLLLTALGLKKRNRPWGTVYDSVTKQPIDPAYVTLKQTDGQGENMSITDLDGRYGFLVTPGKYTLSANKTNYAFPSQKAAGKAEDVLYSNLYFGEELNVDTAGALINKNIPLDPVKFDWNEFVKGEKKLMKFYSRREKIMRIVTDWIFRIGFVVSVISLCLVTAPYNLIIFGLYLILALLRKFGLKQKALGSLTEKDGDPLSFAVIRVHSPDLNNMEITNKVTDKIGRYYCLVPKGKYSVTIEKKNDDESYSLVYTSPVFDAKNGIINENFVV